MTSHDGERVAYAGRGAGGMSALTALLRAARAAGVGTVAADKSKSGGWKIVGPRKPAPPGVMTRQRRRKLLRQEAKVARSAAKVAERQRRRSERSARQAAKS